MKQKFLELVAAVTALVVPYLEALGTSKDDKGNEWPESAVIAWKRGDIESLASYVAGEVGVDEHYAEQLIILAAIANPDTFRMTYMRRGGVLVQGRNADGSEGNGKPVPTISLRRAKSALATKKFVPGQTQFAARAPKPAAVATSDATL